MMADILEEEERMYFGRIRHPHCRTCLCPSEQHPVRLKSKVMSRMGGPLENEWDSSIPYHHPPRMERRYHCDHKYELLEKWFKRFDFDCNGLLDLFELRTLINFLGVRAGDEYCRRLLSRADRDGDGLLTFPEFLMMWRQAQEEEELLEIIRGYDLYPDVVQVDTFRRHRTKPQVIETVKRKYGPGSKCCGCESTVTKTIRRTPEKEHIEYKTKTSHRSHEKFPIFSCYR